MPRDLLIMAISLFAWGVGEGMFLYFQPLYLQKWGANPVEIGAILSLMGIAMAVAQAPAGYLADRVGSRPVMWSSWVLGTLAACIMALANSLTVFVIGMFTYGLTSFVVAPMNSYITSVRGRFSVERAMTIVMAMFYLGAVAGPLLGGIIGESFGLQNTYRLSAGIFFLSTLIVFLAHRPPVEEHDVKHSQMPNLTANPHFMGLLVLTFLTMFSLYLPQPLTPNYLQNQLGFSLRTIGQLGAMASLGNAVIMLGFGHLSAPVGMLVGQALVGLFTFIIWQSQSLPLFYVGYFFVGGYRLCRAMVLALARSLVRSDEVGFAYGLVETGNAISVIVAPLVAGFLYVRNPQSVYVFSLIAIGIMLLVNLVLFFKLPSSGIRQNSDIIQTGSIPRELQEE
jgi:MFS family permease